VTGILAYKLLDDATRSKVIEVLKAHPRFATDFDAARPEGVENPDMWAFSQTAVWPDLARDFEGDDKHYHHGQWHYINLPVFLVPEGADDLMASYNADLDRDWTPDLADDSLNGVQALHKAIAQVSDPNLSNAEKAVALCWLFHLVGDLHQPCHATALVTPGLFPKGDRGANLIRVGDNMPLHHKWDAQLGRSGSYENAMNRAWNLLSFKDFTVQAERASAILDVNVWVEESARLAAKHVYSPRVREHVLKNDAKGELPPFRLSTAYQEDARDVAYARVTEAGYRLAALLKKSFQ